MTPTQVTLVPCDVKGTGGHLNLSAPGPDGILGRVLNECATQSGPIFTQLFI